jgi:hypothetical protein
MPYPLRLAIKTWLSLLLYVIPLRIAGVFTALFAASIGLLLHAAYLHRYESGVHSLALSHSFFTLAPFVITLLIMQAFIQAIELRTCASAIRGHSPAIITSMSQSIHSGAQSLLLGLLTACMASSMLPHCASSFGWLLLGALLTAIMIRLGPIGIAHPGCTTASSRLITILFITALTYACLHAAQTAYPVAPSAAGLYWLGWTILQTILILCVLKTKPVCSNFIFCRHFARLPILLSTIASFCSWLSLTYALHLLLTSTQAACMLILAVSGLIFCMQLFASVSSLLQAYAEEKPL